MSSEVQTTNGALAVQQISAEALEKVMVGGDLAQLSAPQRLEYLNAVCHMANINPMSQPFQFMTFQGKLVLYAKKDCAEQVRRNNNVSIAITDRTRMDGVYIVTAKASLPNGRFDESTGVIAIENLKGESLANAMMKAETKAKRRATFSVCGLGFVIDQTEVDSMQEAAAKPIITASADKVWPSIGAMIADFESQKNRIGPERYYKVLLSEGYEEAKDIAAKKDKPAAQRIWGILSMIEGEVIDA